MTFLELQNYVLSDRFDETKRASAKIWLNHRYGRIWAMEPWTFKLGIVNYNASAGATSASIGTLQRILSFSDSTISPDYSPMEPLRPENFYDWATRTSGTPDAYSVVGNTIYFSAPLSSARTFVAIGELAFVELSADGNTPLIPTEFHVTLAHGAISEGLRQEQDPGWQGAEEDFRAGLEDMKKAYLVSVRNYQDAYPSWPGY